MSNKPLSREERERICADEAWCASAPAVYPLHLHRDVKRYEATVQVAEERAEESEARLRGLRRDWQRETRAREALRSALEDTLREVGELSPGDLAEKIRDHLAADDAARGNQ